jgi:hypothetical protein
MATEATVAEVDAIIQRVEHPDLAGSVLVIISLTCIIFFVMHWNRKPVETVIQQPVKVSKGVVDWNVLRWNIPRSHTFDMGVTPPLGFIPTNPRRRLKYIGD